MKKATTIFVSLALFAFASVSTVFASNISKTFEFGPGTQYSSSVFRTFPVPCGRQVAAVVKFTRLGPVGLNNDIPIIIELREPDTAPNQEGPIAGTKNDFALTTEKTVTIFSIGGGSARGCSLPWRVRVRHANAGSPAYKVSGTARLDYDGTGTSIPSSPIGSLFKGAIKPNVPLGDITGLKQGTISVAGTWSHEIFGADVGLNYIQLRFQLSDPSGRVVQTAEGYSLGGPLTPRLSLVYQVPTCVTGQWKLTITNLSTKDDVKIDAPSIFFTPGCP